jgi:LCP family protein required for cell wall assembly
MDTKIIQTIKISIVILIGMTLLLGIGYILVTWNQPLSDPLDLPEETQAIIFETPTKSPEVTSEPTITLTPTIEPVCGGPLTMNLLVSGVASNNFLYGLADAIRIVRVDFQDLEITVLALPRDLWVEIPGLEDHNITVGKLNQAYFYGSENMGYYQGAGNGSGLMAETLLQNYGLWTDHYLAVNLYSFRKIINTIGGIDVYLASDVYKKHFGEPKLFLKAGSHQLNGFEAEMLARHRITIGDFGRINNQTVILKAVAVKLLSPSGLATVPALIDQLISNVITDLSPGEITQLICLAGMIDFDEDIHFVSLADELLSQDMVYDPTRGLYTSALIGDDEKIRSLMIAFQQGDWPE